MRPSKITRKARVAYAGAGAVLLAVPATAVALTVQPFSSPTRAADAAQPSVERTADAAQTVVQRAALVKHRPVRSAAERGCGNKLFTVNMGERAANAIWSGTGRVTGHQLKVLGYIERCQVNPAAQDFVRGYDRRHGQMHRARIAAARAAAARAAAARAAAARAAAAAPSQAAAAAPAPQSSSSATASTASTASAGGSPLPACTWQPESGGNPHAVNPSSGAGGYYQIMPSTWQAYGGSGAPQNAPMSEQTAIAQKIYANQGPGAWTNC